MKNEIFNKEYKQKVQDFFETNLGSYIKNWLKGLLWLTVVLLIIYIVSCFVTWTVVPITLDSFEGRDGTLFRIGLIVYSIVILLTLCDDDDFYGY